MSPRDPRDRDLYATWQAMSDAGRDEEALRMLDHLLEARPDDTEALLLKSLTLLGLERDGESVGALHRAVEAGKDDPSVLARAASRYFYGGDLKRSRMCLDRARRLAPRDFPLRSELKELNRNLSRREKSLESHERFSEAFDADPSDREAAMGLLRSQMRSGRIDTPYYIVTRALLHHPDDRRLRRIERKLRDQVPADERARAEEWASSGESHIIAFTAPRGPIFDPDE